MKQHKVFLSFVIVVAIFFASIFPAQAIGFDAEEKFGSVFIIRSGNSLGSGFAMGPECVVTNAHVIENPRSVTVYSYDGTERSAQVISMDEAQDIAVLLVPNGNFVPLAVADIQQMHVGDDVYAIGAPKSMGYTLTKGILSAKERQVGLYTYIQTDAPINEGNSGGPLLNDAGQVLGMNTMKMLDSEGLGLAIPISRICAYLQSLGFDLDASGNITGDMAPAQPSQPQQPPSQTDPKPVIPQGPSQQDTPEQTPSWIVIALAVVCAVSVALNILLAIALVWQKNKNLEKQYDPRERTDFDIEILE